MNYNKLSETKTINNHFIRFTWKYSGENYDGETITHLVFERDTPLNQNEFFYNMPYHQKMSVNGYINKEGTTYDVFAIYRNSDTTRYLYYQDGSALKYITVNFTDILQFSDAIINY